MNNTGLLQLCGWTRELLSKRLVSIARLLDDPSDQPSDINRSFEPLLLKVEGCEPVFLTIDEGKGNLFAKPFGLVVEARPQAFGEFIPIEINYLELVGETSLSGFGAIQSVRALSLQMEDRSSDYHACCGVKLTSATGQSFSIGTHLAEFRIPGLWLIPNDEVHSDVHESTLFE